MSESTSATVDARASAPSREGGSETLAKGPPLCGLAALAALCAMVINQLVAPALGAEAPRELFARVTRGGQFATNLAVIAGFIALFACVVSILRGEFAASRRRRILLVVFATILARAVIIATFFERSETTRENVYFAVGAANLLAVLAGITAFERSSGFLRLVSVLATAVPLCALLTVTLELSTDVLLSPWKRRLHQALIATGEVFYLSLLLLSVPVLASRGRRLRDGLSRSAGVGVLVLAIYAVRVAQSALHTDYAVLLYNAQRVGILLDRFPVAYALPFCLVLASAAAALVAGGHARLQAAAGVLLVFASGFAPRAPGRLLTMALGFVILARALTALTRERKAREGALGPGPSSG